MQDDQEKITGRVDKRRMGVLLQFPPERSRQVSTRGYCQYCESGGRLIAKDQLGASWTFRCHCEAGDRWNGFPIWGKNGNVEFYEPRAAK